VLNLPFSREVEQYRYLKRTVALYRLAFGQPRQQDLVAFLEQLEGLSMVDWQIDLSPPGQRRHAQRRTEVASNVQEPLAELSRVLAWEHGPSSSP
jgi:hypothetical protein